MDSLRIPSPTDREVGLRRLRDLTLSVAVAGTAGAIAFGAIAAFSNPGQPRNATSATGGTLDGLQGAVGAAATPLSGDDGTTLEDGGGQAAVGQAPAFQAPAFQAPQQLPFGFSGGGHAASGGSAVR
ncbi:MAG TPA: hypothetical protein VF763_10435 [Candidatus Limnocylindrales bacterium]